MREQFGTMTKPFHAGRAAENGMIAAEIAAMPAPEQVVPALEQLA